MNVLLIYPEFPPSYWSMKYALDFVGKSSAHPPLGLLTVAGLFPDHYNLKVVDMNVEPLTDDHLRWTDVAGFSSMVVQLDSQARAASRCRAFGIPVFAGGPGNTTFHEDIDGVDHFVLGEVENTFSDFLDLLERGTAPPVFEPPRDARGSYIKPSMNDVPLPRYDLIDLSQYGSMALQFSRGCPFDCEFCDITKLYGRVPRTKLPEQMIAEFQHLYDLGWYGALFLVDDNFIGNKRNAKQLLPYITEWQRERGFPYGLYTEASVNLVEVDGLGESMAEAGFDMVFIGLETPNPQALKQTNKMQNVKTDDPDYLLNAVRKIQHMGMEVTAGFISGLDGDDETIFDAQVDFIQKAGIPTAMVGLLTAIKGTDLYDRMKREGRLLEESSGNNVSVSLNFVPEMDREVPIQGYKRELATLYDSTLSNFLKRCETLFKHKRDRRLHTRSIGKTELMALVKSIKRQLFSRQGPSYVKFLTKIFFTHPGRIGEAVRFAIVGYHFQKITSQIVMVDDFKTYLEKHLEELKGMIRNFVEYQSGHVREIHEYLLQLTSEVPKKYRLIHNDFRDAVNDVLRSFQESVRDEVAQLAHVAVLPVPQFV